MGVELDSYQQDRLVKLAESVAESIACDFEDMLGRFLSDVEFKLAEAINRVSESAVEAIETASNAAWSMDRPSVKFRPRTVRHDGKWWALYGDDHINGVWGCGDTVDAAMDEFDTTWNEERGDFSNSVPVPSVPFHIKAACRD